MSRIRRRWRRHRSAGRRASAVLLIGLSAAACGGLPASGHLQTIDRADVPFGLLSTASPGASVHPGVGVPVPVFFVRDDHLVADHRDVVGGNLPADALRALLTGVTAREAASGLTTAVPTGTKLVSLDVSGRVATVDLSEAFGTAGGSQQVLAVAQIVFTLTGSHYIDSVRFAIGGRSIEVPSGAGSLTGGPRKRSDFRKVGPRSG